MYNQPNKLSAIFSQVRSLIIKGLVTLQMYGHLFCKSIALFREQV